MTKKDQNSKPKQPNREDGFILPDLSRMIRGTAVQEKLEAGYGRLICTLVPNAEKGKDRYTLVYFDDVHGPLQVIPHRGLEYRYALTFDAITKTAKRIGQTELLETMPFAAVKEAEAKYRGHQGS